MTAGDDPSRHGLARLGLGTAAFLPAYGIGEDAPLGLATVQAAVRAGIRYVDTAAAYGESEVVLGSVGDTLSDSAVRVCTKVSAEGSSQDIVDRVGASLGRLGARHVDTLLLHSAGPDVIARAAVGEAMQRVKRQGWALRTGVSTYGAVSAQTALAQEWCDSVQVEYNLLHQHVLSSIRACTRPSQEVVVRSVLCKGVLTARRAVLPLPREIVAVLDDADAMGSALGMTLPQLAIRFALDSPGVDVVLVGVAGPSELADALDATRFSPLTEEVMSALTRMDRSSSRWAHPEQWDAPAGERR